MSKPSEQGDPELPHPVTIAAGESVDRCDAAADSVSGDGEWLEVIVMVRWR